MLVLSRKRGEGLFLGDDIEIVVLDIEGGAVKIGIRAPKDVLVLRTELKLTRSQNESASNLPPEDVLDALLDRFRTP